jgi:mevalonate kinase
VRAVKKGDWPAVGKLMDRNQELLREIGVSCDELEQLIKIAKDNGAIGAKLTGTGRGGYMVALTPGKDVQDKVAAAIEAAGFRTLRTTIGG